MKMFVISMLSFIFLTAGSVYAETVDFEDLTLSDESFYNGSDGAGSFESGGATFKNNYDVAFESWDGFAYSNTTDTSTPGVDNQYSAIPGSGANGSENYGVSWMGFFGNIPTIVFPEEVGVTSAEITNTTYAFWSMQNGDDLAKKFGGDSGDDEDWFLLTITGKDADGNVVETIEFYLADFRFTDNSQDYIINKWTAVDLTGLGSVKSLEFSLTSSDNGDWGMNTPAYFAIDNITYSDSDGSDGDLGCFINLIDSSPY